MEAKAVAATLKSIASARNELLVKTNLNEKLEDLAASDKLDYMSCMLMSVSLLLDYSDLRFTREVTNPIDDKDQTYTYILKETLLDLVSGKSIENINRH